MTASASLPPWLRARRVAAVTTEKCNEGVSHSGNGGGRQAGTDEASPEAEARDAVLLAVGEREHEQMYRRAARLPEVVVVAQPVLGLGSLEPG